MAYDVEKMRKNVDESKGGKFWKPRSGKNKVRVLPGVKGKCVEGTFYGSYMEHRMGIEGGGTRFFHCLSGTGIVCPACKAVKLFSASGEGTLQKALKDLKAKTRFNINLIVEDKGDVMMWSPSASRVEEMLDILTDDEWGDFTDLEKGYCLTILKKGDGLQTRYRITASPTKMELPDDWQEQAHDLNSSDEGHLSAKEIRALLVDKYEDVYDNLGQELMLKAKKGAKK